MKGYIIKTPRGKIVTPLLYKTKARAEKDLQYFINFTKQKCKVVKGELK